MYVLADLVLVRATELHKCHVLILPVDQCQDIGLKLKVIKSGVANGSLKEMLSHPVSLVASFAIAGYCWDF